MRSANEFGALVRFEREKRGWSQSQLAEKVGVSLPWISQFERGKQTAQIDLVLKTLNTLEIRLWAGEPPVAPDAKTTMINLDELLARQPGAPETAKT
ncbi:MAG: helix-turn-helix transcriptional regulator [Verrucomicrobiae bacterium]|nr:helix-turn-helix transcriptional regulator [Verrucomicrobiae bacterium]